MTIESSKARQLNRAMWDERVPMHMVSRFYDIDGFRAGRCSLQEFEPNELGAVAGKDLVHLQCHIGLDSLSWARRGARVTGLDFSEPAVLEAQKLADELGLDARFVTSDVFEAPSVLARRFDVVYTGLGALCWLDSVGQWAQVVSSLLRPGGCLYLVEFHPFVDVLGWESLDVLDGYFHDPKGVMSEASGTYTDPSAATHANVSVEYKHPISDVLSALIQEGLRLDHFHEFEHTAFPRWPFLRQTSPVRWEMPADMPRLPLMYSLRASKL